MGISFFNYSKHVKMLKATKFNIADSNIANLGSELETKVREEAANCEEAWSNAGQEKGLQIWRIENFNVVSWSNIGTFYSGDSYIVLNTYENNDALAYDVHFWLGEYTTLDEAGTAAYKTVELDDKLGGAPIQHREVCNHESALFLSYFKNTGGLTILDGGVESGFNHVEPESYQPRLLQIKGIRKNIRSRQVSLSCDSLNSGDVFILDNGLTVYQWNGSSAGIFEKNEAAQLSRAMDDERKGQVTVKVISESDDDEDTAAFFELLGGKGDIKSAEEGGVDSTPPFDGKKLFRVSDASGTLEFEEVASNQDVTEDKLDGSDVFILDTGSEIFTWIGSGSSDQERSKSMRFAQDYIESNNRPAYIPITRIYQGGENEVFKSNLD